MLELALHYGRELVKLLHNGPGYITPTDIRGLIAFPSYHAVLAMLMVWYARTISYLRWPILVLNLVVLASAPVQGGHHLIDIFGGCAVTVLAILVVRAAEAVRVPSVPILAWLGPALLPEYQPEPVVPSSAARTATPGERL